MKVNLLQNSRH